MMNFIDVDLYGKTNASFKLEANVYVSFHFLNWLQDQLPALSPDCPTGGGNFPQWLILSRPLKHGDLGDLHLAALLGGTSRAAALS